MVTRYKIWVEIEEITEDARGYEDFERVGEPIDICTVDTLEEAEERVGTIEQDFGWV